MGIRIFVIYAKPAPEVQQTRNKTGFDEKCLYLVDFFRKRPENIQIGNLRTDVEMKSFKINS